MKPANPHVVILSALLGACGGGSAGTSGNAGTSGGAGTSGPAGTSGGGGTTGGGGAAGSGGAGGAAQAACPSAAPSSGAACTTARSCFYESCAAEGRTVATCSNGAWAIATGPCSSVPCRDMTCQPGQICVQRVGGALFVECVANGCGAAAIGCNCLQSCSGICGAIGSVESGVTIMCNTCPSNMCA